MQAMMLIMNKGSVLPSLVTDCHLGYRQFVSSTNGRDDAFQEDAPLVKITAIKLC